MCGMHCVVMSRLLREPSLYMEIGMSKKKPMHELFGDEYVEAAFELWLKEYDLGLEALFKMSRAKLFKQFKAAFFHGITACQNGNVY